ncbi:3-methyladenine DNA glycosylase AlkD [Pseudoduganella namucuonensis]|uniref:3-methyladenine DNA glycosylase AlkD n=2 Tax=Pseudoduganella namucuonensis TaxID=1035707 RepID=A0A1I7HC00_9BURK|nr:3-methyladenine DNA glycosylase AlkD [Pseudoduganella namucuonensis]
MRNQFPFLGVPTPARRAAGKSLLRALGELNAEALLAMADELWELPEREYQYVALDMLAMHWKKFNVEHIPELMRLARRKSWWDTVDAMAGIIGDVLRHKHDFMDEAINHEDFWIRRIALLHQLGWRDKTDKALLLGYCLQLAHEQEFFIQKAIGWALRDYARHDPAGVRAFINTNKSLLAPLSYREANKHL